MSYINLANAYNHEEKLFMQTTLAIAEMEGS